MTTYIIKRVLMVIIIVLVATLIIYTLLYALTSSRVRSMPIYGDGDALDSVFELLNVRAGFFTRYLRYCYNVFIHFDFGRSDFNSLRLMRELNIRLRNTILILTSGVGATLIIGIPVGVYTAIHKNRAGDRILSIVFLFLSSIPSYAIAMIIALTLAVYLRVLPITGDYRTARAFIMPMLSLAIGGISTIARMTRANMLEALEQPFIIALRAKGLKEKSVVYRHALKNALVPIISALGGLISQLLCWALVIELFFNVPGLGSYLLRSVGGRDHFEILGSVVLMTLILAVMNLASDILYAIVNPQIRLRYNKPRKVKIGKESAQ